MSQKKIIQNMNEVILVDHPGDKFDDLLETALEIVKISGVGYAVFTFNGIKLFVKKDSTAESVFSEYRTRLEKTLY